MTQMCKIVYNNCFGGFGLSEAGMRRYAELKGLTLYPEPGTWGSTWWTVPPEQRRAPLEGEAFYEASLEERQASNQLYKSQTISDRDIPRDDPALARVVEELGKAASGRYADLQIRALPVGTRYRIDEYDGNESVVAQDEYDWQIAS